MSIQCQMCTRFMSAKDLRGAVTWTRFGGYLDYEPPDPEYAHFKCWERASEKDRAMTEAVAWVKPHSRGE